MMHAVRILFTCVPEDTQSSTEPTHAARLTHRGTALTCTCAVLSCTCAHPQIVLSALPSQF
jgi:hypothetical protein